MLAGCRPRAPRSFCFGKRTQNHWRPCVALRVPLPRSRKVRAAELASLRQSSPPKQVSGLGQSPARRRHEVAPEAGAATTTRFFTSFRMGIMAKKSWG